MHVKRGRGAISSVLIFGFCWGKGDLAAWSLSHIDKGGHCEICGGILFIFYLLINESECMMVFISRQSFIIIDLESLTMLAVSILIKYRTTPS